jgi:hypothetical protein
MKTRPMIAWAASGIYLVALVLSGRLVMPPANLPIYCFLLVMAIVPLALGSTLFRAFGAIACALAVFLIVREYKEGRDARRIELRKQDAVMGTNSPAAAPRKP